MPILTVGKDFDVVDGDVLLKFAFILFGDEELAVLAVLARSQHGHLHLSVV